MLEPKRPIVNLGKSAGGKAFCLYGDLTAEVFCKKRKYLQMSYLFPVFINTGIHTLLMYVVTSQKFMSYV